MKKKLLVLLMPLLLFGLTGCVLYNGQGKPSKSSAAPKESSQVTPSGDNSSGEPSSTPSGDASSVTPQSSVVDPDALPKGTDVKIYLVFGEYGLYQNEEVDDKVPELFLEHTIEYQGKVGDLLPTDKEVTSSVEGSKFLRWVAYNDDGKLTEYIKVPGYDNKILYAWFSGGNGGEYASGSESGEVVPEEPQEPSTDALPTSGYGIKFSDDSYIQAVRAEDFEGFSQYKINSCSFTTGQIFQLYNFEKSEGWVVGLRGSLEVSEYVLTDYTTQTYKVLQDFSVESIFIKMKYGEDEIWINFAS